MTDQPALPGAKGCRALGLSLKERMVRLDGTVDSWAFLLGFASTATDVAVVLLIAAGVTKLYNMDIFRNFSSFSIAIVAMLLFVIYLTTSWVYWAQRELSDLFYWLKTPALRAKHPVFALLLSWLIAGFFATLIIFIDAVHIIFFVYTFYIIFDIFAWWFRRREITIAIVTSAETLNTSLHDVLKHAPSPEARALNRSIARIYLNAYLTIKTYYFERFHITRDIIGLIVTWGFFWVALSISCRITSRSYCAAVNWILINIFVSKDSIGFQGHNLSIDHARFLAYILFVSWNLISEWVLYRWRNEAQRRLIEGRGALALSEFAE